MTTPNAVKFQLRSDIAPPDSIVWETVDASGAVVQTTYRPGTGPRVRKGESPSNYRTPPEFLAAVESRFGQLTFDLAARPHTHSVVPNRTWFDGVDSLKADWSDPLVGARPWLNSPWNEIKEWVSKCARTSLPEGTLLLHLLPFKPATRWFRENVEGWALVLSIGRLRFVGQTHQLPMDLALAVYGAPSGFEHWDWRPRKHRAAKAQKAE